MEIFTGRNGVLAVGLFAIFGCAICDDGGSSNSPPPLQTVTVRGFWPCIGTNPTEVRVFGSNLNVPTHGTFGIGSSTIVSHVSSSELKMTVNSNASTGSMLFFDSYSRIVGTSVHPFTVGADTPVPEIEPNEDINGADATPMGPRTQGTGTLAGILDRDHFRRDCFMPGATYSVTINPPIVGAVFVNGVGVALDGSGRGTFQATDHSQLFGLTGGNGAYTMTIGFVNP